MNPIPLSSDYHSFIVSRKSLIIFYERTMTLRLINSDSIKCKSAWRTMKWYLEREWCLLLWKSQRSCTIRMNRRERTTCCCYCCLRQQVIVTVRDRWCGSKVELLLNLRGVTVKKNVERVLIFFPVINFQRRLSIGEV